MRQEWLAGVTQERPERSMTATARVQPIVTDLTTPSGWTRRKGGTVNLWKKAAMTLKDWQSM